MIGQLTGILLAKQPPQLLIEVGGVGYEVDAPMSTFDQLPALSEKVVLLTHFVVREDAQQLYGFYTHAERKLFRTLIKVNGIGPRSALAILSSIEIDEFIKSIVQRDMTNLTRLPGIGKKTAERLIIEMQDALSHWESPNHLASPLPLTEMRHTILQDAVAALMSLGYKPTEANRLVTKVDNGTNDRETLIRLALRENAL